jgi:hypothetical protein
VPADAGKREMLERIARAQGLSTTLVQLVLLSQEDLVAFRRIVEPKAVRDCEGGSISPFWKRARVSA